MPWRFSTSGGHETTAPTAKRGAASASTLGRYDQPTFYGAARRAAGALPIARDLVVDRGRIREIAEVRRRDEEALVRDEHRLQLEPLRRAEDDLLHVARGGVRIDPESHQGVSRAAIYSSFATNCPPPQGPQPI